MNYKNKITRKAQAAAVAKLVMRYIPIIIKRLGKTIGPGGVAKLVDAVVQFITSKSQVNEQDARAAAEQYLREHPEVAQQFSQQPAQAKMAISLRTSGWKGELAGGVGGGMAGGTAGAAVGGALGTAILPGVGTAIGAGVGEAAGNLAGGYVGSKIGDKAGDAMDKDTMNKKYSDTAQDFISKEISHLVHDKHMTHDQAVAVALNVAREKGYEIPDKG
jgi:hypothetical protein